MQQIRQVIKRKQSQLAQLTKEIDLLQQAEEKLREIAPLLAEGDEDEGSLLVEV
jgi:prefoldin subunit 5